MKGEHTILPRPKIEVTKATERDPEAGPGVHDIVISREGFQTVKTYRADGNTTAEVVKDAVEKILSDKRVAEDLP